MGGTWLIAVASEQEGLRCDSLLGQGLSMCMFSPFELVPSGCAYFLPHAKDMQVRVNGDSKLPEGVNVSVYGCL